MRPAPELLAIAATRMRLLASVVAITLLTPCLAGAQADTGDGIQALIRGDYATAARILRPLAEDTPTPDPIAQFFMAVLYHSGLGVGPNQMRACGLFLAAARPSNVLMTQALALAAGIHHDIPLMTDSCLAASVESWRSPPSTTFALGADHWVRVDDMGLTVGYNGTQKRPTFDWGGPGYWFLPTRYTPLDVSAPITTTRHFIEFFVWTPDRASDPPVWTLRWFVYEVVGLDLVPLPSERTLATIAAVAPPASPDDRQRAGLRINADGEAEAVVSGSEFRQ